MNYVPPRLWRPFLLSAAATCLLVAGFGIVPKASADTRIDLTLAQQGANQSYAVYVSAGKVRLHDALNRADFIYNISGDNARNPMMTLLDHQRKTYTSISQAKLTELAAMVEQLGNIARSQGGVLGNLMSTFGLDNEIGKQPDIKLASQGITKRVAGVECTPTKVVKDGRITTTLCLADSLPIEDADLGTLRSLLDFSQQLATQAGSVLSALGASVPLLPKAKVPGYPVSTRDEHIDAQVSRIHSEPVSDNWFQIPPEYVRSELPLG